MSKDEHQPNAPPTKAPGRDSQGVEGAAGASLSGGPPTVSLPKGGAAIKGIGEKFAANPVTGTGALTVPIPTSPARSGFGPQLALSYDSGAGNGPFGFGWGLSLPSITRKTDKALPQYRDAEESDVFILSGAEDLVPLLEGTDGRWGREAPAERDGYSVRRYRPRVEGLFARVEHWTDLRTGESHWRSITRDNVTTLYGRDDDSRIFAHGGPDAGRAKRVFSWLICQSYDGKGNAVVYEYAREDGANVDLTRPNERNRARAANRYLKRIKYGNRVSRLTAPGLEDSGWMFEVVFDYDEGHCEELARDPERPAGEQHESVRAWAASREPWAVRPDPFSSHRAGFEVRTYRRCRRVLMFHRFPELGAEPYLVRSTEFDYADFDYSGRPPVGAELAHAGSTRFASFIRAVTQSGFVRDETQRARESGSTYLKKSLPPLEFQYSRAEVQEEVRELDAVSLRNLPAGVDGATYRFVDLDGEGVSGILTEQAGAWFYKPSLGGGKFGALEPVSPKPSLADLGGGRQQLLDLSGDGQVDLVCFDGPTPGFYERTRGEGWDPFRVFEVLPNIRWDDPNLRFVDLNGDGHADVLIAEDEVFAWHPSLAEDGFGPARRSPQAFDEEKGPRLVFADGTQSVHLADMCGDGLADLVRIRNGEVCYWPNLGYGRFGAKVSMDDAPRFDNPDRFDQRRVRLADIDGSGANDIIYLGRDGARIYFNQSGNSWAGPRHLARFPPTDGLSSVTTADLLGNGTACLVWSSPLPAASGRTFRYMDLMGGQKPHLLTGVVNNLGAETRIRYEPSTKFYLDDKAAGRPWITRLPFPVHVVERVETYDRVSGARFVTRYAYHHGHFDGDEREFRGFGLVEQWDTEEFGLDRGGEFPAGTNFEESSHVPPVLTRTWSHTGAYLSRGHVSDFFAGLAGGDHPGEYYREPGLTDAQARRLLLDDTVLPAGLNAGEEREACRALKGSMLRREVYARDRSDKAQHPYTVTEQNFAVRLLQPRAGNRHAVFFTHARESVSYHYERDPADPRVSHMMTLEVDDFGNVLSEAAVGYGRRLADAAWPEADRRRQTQPLVTYTESRFTNPVDGPDDYLAPLPCETRAYELTGLPLAGGAARFTPEEVAEAAAAAAATAYEESPDEGVRQKRLIEHARTLYRSDDLTGPLPLCRLQSLALPFETYRLAFTPGMPAAIYGGRLTNEVMEAEGRYVHSEGDAGWWVPSGRAFYSPDTTHTPSQELAYARAHFFLPLRFRNPFHTDELSTETHIAYDAHDLLVQETRDPLGNLTTAGERDEDDRLKAQGNDYRVLQPRLVMDANRNRASVAFDALGLVAGTAVMGKPEDLPPRGDRLDTTFRADPTQADIDRFFADPRGPAAESLLGDATTRLVYDLTAYRRGPDAPGGTPVFVATLARETHVGETAPAGGAKIQVSFSYSDGFGREVQKKFQAERGPDAPPGGRRWVGSGWTVFNNKGKPARQYEPFFTDTHRFEFDSRAGVSRVLFYDPLERPVATLHPNRTWEKTVFDAWRQRNWDANDTATIQDPKSDPDVGDFFKHLPEASQFTSWYEERVGGRLGAAERRAAAGTADHAETPTTVHFDALGRAFLTVAHNKYRPGGESGAVAAVEEHLSSRVELDIEGNQRAVRDSMPDPTGLGRAVMLYDYDMLGNRVRQVSADAGARWTLNDVAGKPIRAWDERGHSFLTEYDQLRRPLRRFARREGRAEPGPGVLFEHVVYGDSPAAGLSARQALDANLRTRVYRQHDAAGVTTNEAYDFKGNLLRSTRRLLENYKDPVDWRLDPALEQELFTSGARFDALNRITQQVAPHSDRPGARLSVVQPAYNDANLLERVYLWQAREAEPEELLDPDTASLRAVTNIDYNAKGQRTAISYGNGARTFYEYDRDTFRLTRLLTLRDAAAFPGDCPDEAGAACGVQNLRYTYDPVGNVTQITDAAQPTVYFDNEVVTATASYAYDALYRVIVAEGREHAGQAGRPLWPTWDNAHRSRLAHPGDGRAMRNYRESYQYDAAGNILAVIHRAKNGDWTRTYQYDGPNTTPANNRLTGTRVGGGDDAHAESYTYDEHGNMTSTPHLPLQERDPAGTPPLPGLAWDFKDQLHATRRQVRTDGGTPECTYYTYDALGQRARKVTEGQADPGAEPRKIKERIYLAGFEIYREYDSRGDAPALERETLHVMDDKRRIALIETGTVASAARLDAPAPLARYQLGNHLGSACLELDAAGAVISYEEYYPYGGTSYQAVRADIEVPSKRYRYSGKERDDETGLYYYGARYYAPWLGRWTSCDPAGAAEGPNLYVYVANNPIRLIDADGRSWEEALAESRIRAAEDQIRLTKHGTPERQAALKAHFEAVQAKEEAELTSWAHREIGFPIALQLAGAAATAPVAAASAPVRVALVGASGFGLGEAIQGETTSFHPIDAAFSDKPFVTTAPLKGDERVWHAVGSASGIVAGIAGEMRSSPGGHRGATAERKMVAHQEGKGVYIEGQETRPSTKEEAELFRMSNEVGLEMGYSEINGKKTPIYVGEPTSVQLPGGGYGVDKTVHTHPVSGVARFSTGDVRTFKDPAHRLLPSTQHSVLGEKWPHARRFAEKHGLEPIPVVPYTTTVRQADLMKHK